MINSHIN